MEIFGEDRPVTYDGTVVALGNFDGLHIAHMEIIRNGIRYAKENGLKSGVLLFEEHTKGVTANTNVSLITPNEAKAELLQRENADFIYVKKFTPDFMRTSPEEFITRLIDRLHMKAVCVGYDYRFGYKAHGTVETLRKLGEKYGFSVFVTDVIKLNGHIVSSTYIRELIKSGDMEETEKFLGRRFCVEGIVEKGKQNGRKMGVPTANVAFDKRMAIPRIGVYAGITYVDGRRLKCVINVGSNPTFNADRLTIESHILDFDEDIYGKYVRVSFAHRLRGDRKFSNMDELRNQINKDIQMVRGMNL